MIEQFNPARIGRASTFENIVTIPLVQRVSSGYTLAVKDAGLRIRVQRHLRDEFLQICHAQDKSAAQVLREFMREYVTTYGPANDTAKPPPAKKKSEAG